MNILGLQCGYNGGVCVVNSGQLIGQAATGENLKRGISKEAIKEALESAQLKLSDIDMAAVVNWHADKTADGTECWDKNEQRFSMTKDNGIEYSLEDYIIFYNDNRMVAQGTYNLNIDNQSVKCMVVDHLFAHAAYAYLTSPFTSCMAVCIDTHDLYGANNAIYWIQDEEKAFRVWRRDQTFSALNVYTGMTDILGMYPALENLDALRNLAAEHKGKKLDMSDWIWPNNVQMGNIFHGDQGIALTVMNGIKNVPEKFGYFPQLSGEGETDDAWMNKDDPKTHSERAQIADSVWSVVEGSIRNYVEKIKVLGGQTAIGGKVTQFENLVSELEDERTHFTKPHNDDELGIGAALFVSDQLMKTKKNEITTNTKKKVNFKEV